MTRDRRRCVLVPARPDQLWRAAEGGYHEIVVDLANSPEAEKTDFVRLAIVGALGSAPVPTVAIQINRSATRWFDEDIIQLVMAVDTGVDCMVVPDVEHPEQLAAAGQLLDEIEAEFPVARPIGLEARIGTSQGAARAAAIVASSPRLEAIVVDTSSLQDQALLMAAADDHGLSLVAGPEVAATPHPGIRFAGAWVLP